MNKNLIKINKEKIINIFIVFIVVALYILVFMFIYNDFRERKRKDLSGGIINKIDEIIENSIEENNVNISEAEIKYDGYKYTVLGKLSIKKIKLNEPILKENTASAYDTALVKIAGPNLNENGNVSIGGHNYMKGNYFIKINKLVKDDVVNITDLTGNSVDYIVYEYGIYNKDDASYLSQPYDKNDKIITLVTCTKGGVERYVVKARKK